VEVVAPLGALIVFAGIYAFLHRRAAGRGEHPRVRWGWLALVIGCAAVAFLIGAVSL
jgi:hypothetical protein